jgi:superfamily II DNA or RNA helicase
MSYQEFLENKKLIDLATGIPADQIKDINPMLFDFQSDIVKWALKRGRAAIWADCGLGKSPMQLEWAKHVQDYTQGNILILAPLAVSEQTVREGKKFHVDVNICVSQSDVKSGISITNYEKIDKFDIDSFAGVILDESSIIKNFSGKIRNKIIESCLNIPFKLACTATPAPNDFMEIGNHSEFLGSMTRQEMLAMFFINDTKDTGTWRLKGHAKSSFWSWVCSWAIMIRKPSDLGYDDGDFILPELNIIPTVIETKKTGDFLFQMEAKTLSERQAARRDTIQERAKAAADIVNQSPDDSWLIWCNLNPEADTISSMINGVNVQGSDKDDVKSKNLLGFANGEIKRLVTKPKIGGMGLNFQSCHNVIFLGLSDSWEQYYQSIRRCWRFGQKYPVNCYIVTADIEGAVVSNIERKEKDADIMTTEMIANMKDINSMEIHGMENKKSDYKTKEEKHENFTLYLGDCVEWVETIPDDSIHYSLFSPPFASLFTYSNSDRDMGNCKNHDEFLNHFKYLASHLFRVTMPGRLLSFHCMNLPATITHDGYIGIKDLRGDLIRIFEHAGFIFHSEVCIWKDPLVQATRTKTLTLAHKQISKDAARCAQGYPDYIVTMRKNGDNPEPVAKGRGFEKYVGDMPEPTNQKTDNQANNKYSHMVWQRYASPVWFDINQKNTLNAKLARENNDERHMCPLQLDTIERCLELWTNPGDTVLSPFAGIGSEGYGAILAGRKFIGVELKESYFNVALQNLIEASEKMHEPDLFDIEN